MDQVTHISAVLPKIDGESLCEHLRNMVDQNPGIVHHGESTRYLICTRDVHLPTNFFTRMWSKPMHSVVIMRTDYRYLDDNVVDAATETTLNGGTCYVATTSELMSEDFSFSPFWPLFLKSVVDKAKDNPTGPVKVLARLLVNMMVDRHQQARGGR